MATPDGSRKAELRLIARSGLLLLTMVGSLMLAGVAYATVVVTEIGAAVSAVRTNPLATGVTVACAVLLAAAVAFVLGAALGRAWARLAGALWAIAGSAIHVLFGMGYGTGILGESIAASLVLWLGYTVLTWSCLEALQSFDGDQSTRQTRRTSRIQGDGSSRRRKDS